MPTRTTRKASTTRPPTRRTARITFIGGDLLQGTCHQNYGPATLTSCRICCGFVGGVESRSAWSRAILSVLPRHSGSGTLRHHRSGDVRRAEPFQTGAHLVSHLTAPHRTLELAPHAEHLVGGHPRGGNDHGGVFVGEGPRESLHRVEGVL